MSCQASDVTILLGSQTLPLVISLFPIPHKKLNCWTIFSSWNIFSVEHVQNNSLKLNGLDLFSYACSWANFKLTLSCVHALVLCKMHGWIYQYEINISICSSDMQSTRIVFSLLSSRNVINAYMKNLWMFLVNFITWLEDPNRVNHENLSI